MGCLNLRASPAPFLHFPEAVRSLAKNGNWGEGLPRPHALAPSFAVLPNPLPPPHRDGRLGGAGVIESGGKWSRMGGPPRGISVSLPPCLPAPGAQDFAPAPYPPWRSNVSFQSHLTEPEALLERSRGCVWGVGWSDLSSKESSFSLEPHPCQDLVQRFLQPLHVCVCVCVPCGLVVRSISSG